jgi:hypothetical protein
VKSAPRVTDQHDGIPCHRTRQELRISVDRSLPPKGRPVEAVRSAPTHLRSDESFLGMGTFDPCPICLSAHPFSRISQTATAVPSSAREIPVPESRLRASAASPSVLPPLSGRAVAFQGATIIVLEGVGRPLQIE